MAKVGTPGAIQAPPYSAGVLGQGISYPPEYTSNGRLKLSWGTTLVDESIESIAATQDGERVMLPGYGAGHNIFEPFDEHRQKLKLEENIANFEPRARNVRVDVTIGDRPGDAISTVTYEYDGEATPRTLTFPLFKGPE